MTCQTILDTLKFCQFQRVFANFNRNLDIQTNTANIADMVKTAVFIKRYSDIQH